MSIFENVAQLYGEEFGLPRITAESSKFIVSKAQPVKIKDANHRFHAEVWKFLLLLEKDYGCHNMFRSL